MKRKILSLLLFSLAMIGFAQNNSEIKSRINSVKRSSSYLSAEATMATEEEAMTTAKELLVSEINEWIRSKRKGDLVKQVVLQDINTYTQRMDMKRGVKTRAFVFVKKKDIVLIYGEGQIVLNENEKGTDLQNLSSITEDMNETRVEEQPRQSASKQSDKRQYSQRQSAQSSTSSDSQELSSMQWLDKIRAARHMSQMKELFSTLKQKGRIQYGAYDSHTNEDTCFLLFYTRTGDIKSVVSKSGQELTDLRSGQSVTFSSFSGCAAYWFKLK